MFFYKQIEKIYKSKIFARCDDTESVFYFSPADFPGLSVEPYPFSAAAGHTLCGYFYAYPDARTDRIVVFDHGFGGGHRAYMKEIALLCRRGYVVFSYDHTGCMESGGTDTNGFGQSLCDLNDCIYALKADARTSGKSISVVGHSWGGFATLNIPALHPDITHTVVLAAPVSVETFIRQMFSGILKGYRKGIYALEKSVHGHFAEIDGRETLQNAQTKALLIYSENDPIIQKAWQYDLLHNALCDRENVTFLLVENKGHNPNYTADAVAYMGAFFAERTKKQKSGALQTAAAKKAFLQTYDWHRMTAQDEGVWEVIFEHLES